MEERKLIKVVFEYDDGTSKYIETDQLDNWGGMNRQVAIFCQSHNANPRWQDIKWTEVNNNKKEEVNDESEQSAITAID